jgi:hypothetical protein
VLTCALKQPLVVTISGYKYFKIRRELENYRIFTDMQQRQGFFVASYAESRLSQGNLNQPYVAFCFISAAIS